METVTLAAGGEELIRLSIAGAGANASLNKSFFRCTASGDFSNSLERSSPKRRSDLATKDGASRSLFFHRLTTNPFAKTFDNACPAAAL
jgi:hypothetical protein